MWIQISTKNGVGYNKKAQLTLTNPRDAKPCQIFLHFEVLTIVPVK